MISDLTMCILFSGTILKWHRNLLFLNHLQYRDTLILTWYRQSIHITYFKTHRHNNNYVFKLLFVKIDIDFLFPKTFLHMKSFKLKLDFCKESEKN